MNLLKIIFLFKDGLYYFNIVEKFIINFIRIKLLINILKKIRERAYFFKINNFYTSFLIDCPLILFLKIFKKDSFIIAFSLLITSLLKLLALILRSRLIVGVISNILTPALINRLINKLALKIKIYLRIMDENY